jgi:hypothetical protein
MTCMSGTPVQPYVTDFELVVCNEVDLDFQLRGKYEENRSIGNILTGRDILSLDRCVTVQFTSLQPLRYWEISCTSCLFACHLGENHVIANKQ